MFQLPQRPERRAYLFTEELRFFPGGEVSTPLRFVEVGEGRVALLDPAARRPKDLVRKRGEADGERDGWRGLACRERLGASALPVRPGRRGSRTRQPVQRDVVEDVVP